MPYMEMVRRSFSISWNHKYLWLLALFSGESGFSFSYSQSQRTPANGQPPDFNTFTRPYTDWIGQHVALVVTLAVISLVLLVAFFVLAAICEGALVRGSAEHDAERPFHLGMAWRTGLATMGTLIRFRLLLIALGLPAFVLIGGVVAGLVIAIVSHNTALAVGLGLVALLVVLITIVYLIYLVFLDRLGTRAAVLELLGARASIVRAHRLLSKRFGRVLLVWLLSIGVGIGVGICVIAVLGILVLPLTITGVSAYQAGSGLFGVVLAIGLLIVLPIVLVVEGFVVTQGSTYWTLAFRRLEIDQAPAYAYPYGYPPHYPQATPPPVAPSA